MVLTPHSAIFQLYSEGTVVQFPNFDLLSGTQRHGQLVFSVPFLPRHGDRDVQRRLQPPCHQRAHTQWGYAGNRTQIFQSTVQPVTSAPSQDIHDVWDCAEKAFTCASVLCGQLSHRKVPSTPIPSSHLSSWVSLDFSRTSISLSRLWVSCRSVRSSRDVRRLMVCITWVLT